MALEKIKYTGCTIEKVKKLTIEDRGVREAYAVAKHYKGKKFMCSDVVEVQVVGFSLIGAILLRVKITAGPHKSIAPINCRDIINDAIGNGAFKARILDNSDYLFSQYRGVNTSIAYMLSSELLERHGYALSDACTLINELSEAELKRLTSKSKKK